MKLLNKLVCLILLFLMPLGLSVFGKEEAIDLSEFPVRDVRVPLELYEDGVMKVQMFAEGARVKRDGEHERKNETELAGVRVEFYTPDGATNASLFSEGCIYHSAIKAVMSERFVKIEKGGLIITGTGFKWKSSTQTFELMNKAKVDFPGKMREEGGKVARTVIQSDYLKFDYFRNLAYFKDNVIVKDSLVDLTSDRLTVLFEGTNSIKTATADGNVHAVAKEGDVTCGKAIFFSLGSKIIMTGDATVVTEGRSLTGEKITVWADENRMVCEQGRLVVPEKKSKVFDGFQMDAEPLNEAVGK